jgi:hypothetical protein
MANIPTATGSGTAQLHRTLHSSQPVGQLGKHCEAAQVSLRQAPIRPHAAVPLAQLDPHIYTLLVMPSTSQLRELLAAAAAAFSGTALIESSLLTAV